ncbi:MAG TPA: MlaD family protein [Candidatus Baltobacteraceae bacterium]|nr:MlaD family protein [Candidatus Baltobacteraceae bacterium]
MSRQAQLGLFAVFAVLLLFGIFYVITDYGTRHSGYRFGVHFASAAGLPTGAQVFFSGVTVGTVDQIKLLPDNTVDVVMALQNDINIPKGSRFMIQAPITGTPNMIIFPPVQPPPPPGTSAPPTPIPADMIWPKRELPLSDQPVGSSAPTFADMMAEGQGEVKRLDDMLSTLQKREPVLLSQLSTTMSNIESMTSQMKGSISELTGTMDQTMQVAGGHIENMTATLDTTLNRNQYRIDSMLTSLDQTAVALNKSMDALQSMATDPRLKGNLIDTTANIRMLTGNIATLTGDLRNISGNPQTQAQLRDTVANLDATMQKADSLLGTLGGRSHVYGVDAGATPYPVPKGPNQLPPPGTQTPPPNGSGVASLKRGLGNIVSNLVQVQLRLSYLSKQTATGPNPLLTGDQGPQADFNALLLPHGPVSAMIGANDIGGKTTYNLAGMKNAGLLHAGGGVLYSQLGVMASLDTPVGFETRVYNLRRPTLDVYGNFALGKFGKAFVGQRDLTRPQRRTVYGLQLQF